MASSFWRAAWPRAAAVTAALSRGFRDAGRRHHSASAFRFGIRATTAVASSAAAAAAVFAVTGNYRPVLALNREPHRRVHKDVVRACVSDLVTELGAEKVATDDAARESHSKDFSFHPPAFPDAVVYPTTTEDVQTVLRACTRHKVPVVAYGAATSLEGHVLPVRGGITLDFANMKSVVAIRPADLDATVQPGISYNDLNEILAPHGLFFPPDPGAGASIGGMVGTSCAGTNAVRHGTMKENVLNLTVVLADGEVVRTRRRSRKSSAGYDLTHLFVGAEGTLGIVTEVSLKLHPIPESTGVATCSFDGIGAATATAADILGQGVPLGRIELMDEVAVMAVNRGAGMRLPEKPLVLFEFAGSRAEVDEQIQRVQKIAQKHGGGSFVFATDEETKEDLWRARKEAYWSAYTLRPNAEIWTTDVCVPISRLEEIIEATKADLADAGIIAPLVSHAGDGNFHLLMLIDPEDDAELQKASELNRRMVHRAIAADGTCTGEHGVGEGKMEFLERELGAGAVALMRSLKDALDPDHILNPGKVIPPMEAKGVSSQSETRKERLQANLVARSC